MAYLLPSRKHLILFFGCILLLLLLYIKGKETKRKKGLFVASYKGSDTGKSSSIMK